MKKILTLVVAAAMSCLTISAQTFADFKKAVAKYRNINTVTAVVTKTTHKAAVAKDEIQTGTLTVKTPTYVCITTNGGKDGLLMDNTAFTMTLRGRKAKTDSKKNTQFKTFHDVLESIFSGGNTDITKNNDIKLSKNGQNLILTITPEAKDKKSQKRQLFTSFTVTIDSKTSEMRSLRLNQKGGSYQEYNFSGYKMK